MYSSANIDGPTTAIMRNLGSSAPPPRREQPDQSFRSQEPRAAFRPAPNRWTEDGLRGNSRGGEEDEHTPAKPFAGKFSSSLPFTSYLVVGSFTLGMLMLVPVWNAVALKADIAFVLFVGTTMTNIIIAMCLSVLVLYVAVVCCIFRSAPSNMQSEAAMAAVFACFLTVLGIVLFAISSPMHTAVLMTTTDVWTNCRFGASTHDLFDASESLQALRALPDCATRTSVEQCAGYAGSPSAMSLKAMEAEYHCSGFCFEPPAGNLSAEEAALGSALNLPPCRSSPPPCVASPFPPSLFSLANDEVSCSGVAAREVGTFGKEASDQLFYEAVMLAIVPALLGFARLLGQACYSGRGESSPAFRSGNRGLAPTGHYGATLSQPRGRFAGASYEISGGSDAL